jgi:hypothetical protein
MAAGESDTGGFRGNGIYRHNQRLAGQQVMMLTMLDIMGV